MSAGAWEIKERKKVLVGILHTDVVTLAWAFGLRNLIIPGDICPIAGMPFDHARNHLVQTMMQGGYEYVFFLDSDVIPGSDAILRLLSRNEPFISGLYSRRSPPHSIPVAIKNGQWVTNYVPGSVIEVDKVGAGCLLISRKFFESIPPQRPGYPWFDWRVNFQGTPGLDSEYCQSEDFTLCSHARAHGFRVMLDTSVVCRHCGYAQATHGQFVPMETIPNT